MMNRITMLALVAAIAGAAHAEEFKITVTDTGPQPLSPLFFSASTSAFDIFQPGGTASQGITNISEFGNASVELGYAAASSAVGTYGLLGGSPLLPGGTRTTTFTADSAHSNFSFAAMLGITNDGFIGDSVSSAGLQLFNNGQAQSLNIIVWGANTWDAGAALDAQTAATLAHFGGTPIPINGTIQSYANGLTPGVGDYAALGLAQYNWNPGTEMAHIQVQAVPEPAPIAAMGFGLLALVRRRRKAN